jgi:hypothetical protein
MIENNRALSVARRSESGIFRSRDYGPQDGAGERCSMHRCSDAIRGSPRLLQASTADVDNFVGNLAQRVAKP